MYDCLLRDEYKEREKKGGEHPNILMDTTKQWMEMNTVG